MNMQSILRWSLENTEAQGSPSGSDGNRQPPRTLDPGIIDAILGKPDSEQMKEALACAVDESKDEDARLTALDDFEMVRKLSAYVCNGILIWCIMQLIEQIDNANSEHRLSSSMGIR